MPFAGWSPIGIAALVALGGGIVLLVGYAMQRGLVHRELEGIEETIGDGDEAPLAPSAPPRRSRAVGALGATLLVVGLALGLISAAGSRGDGTVVGGPGVAPADCAQTWTGCPKATPNP